MEEVRQRLLTNDAKKARELLELAMSARQAFQVLRTQVMKDVLLGNPTSFTKIEKEAKEI